MDTAGSLAISGPTVFFTGAGISVGAGLPTYRGTGGLYEGTNRQPPHARDLSPDRLAELWARFGERVTAAREVEPSRAHRHIAALEGRHPHSISVVTQNVDGLHTAAGSSQVIELHGSLRSMRCMPLGHACEVEQASWVAGVPACPTCGAPCRPNVVLFGETLPQHAWAQAKEAIAGAETVIAVGTSAAVYPAALLIDDGPVTGRRLLWINPETEPPSAEWTWLMGDADTQVARLQPA